MGLTKDMEKNKSVNEERQTSSLEAFVQALGTIMSEDSIDQKTELSDRNIQGMMKLLSYNDHLEFNFGFRIRCVDVMIAEKLIKTISMDRQGKNEILELFRAMKLELESGDIPVVGNRMVVQRR